MHYLIIFMYQSWEENNLVSKSFFDLNSSSTITHKKWIIFKILSRQRKQKMPLWKIKWDYESMKTHFDSKEVEPTFIGQGLGYHGFRAAWGSVEQDSFRWLDPHACEGLRVPERPLHSLLQFQLHFLHPAYVWPADLEGGMRIKSGDWELCFLISGRTEIFFFLFSLFTITLPYWSKYKIWKTDSL